MTMSDTDHEAFIMFPEGMSAKLLLYELRISSEQLEKLYARATYPGAPSYRNYERLLERCCAIVDELARRA